LIILGVVLLAFGILYIIYRKHLSALYYIVGAGVLYGFVATLAKVVLTSVIQNNMTALSWVCLVALLAASALGALFVQNAYSSGPPDLVIAGLTVIDPIVAVAIGITILDEASQAPTWAIGAFIVAGIIAVIGVFMLAKYHPDARQDLEHVGLKKI
jgi:drug/metabolite transporter (DMT)-like permease